MIKREKYAFSLAEMMLVMLIISILTAAMLPVISRRQKDSAGGGGHCLWTESVNNSSDIYSRESANSSVIVGATNRLGSGNEKLQINSTVVGTPQLGFAETGNVIAAIMVDSSNNILFGNTVSKGYNPSDSIAFGHNVTVNYANAVAIGSGTSSAPTLAAGGGVAIGFKSTSTGINCVSIGNSAAASDDEAVAIGNTATATDASSTAIGAAKASNIYASAFGASANALSFASTALGAGSNVSGNYGIAIGNGAKTSLSGKATSYSSKPYVDTGNDGIAIGRSATSIDGGVSLGYLSTTSFNRWSSLPPVAIGYNSSATDGSSIAIGSSASSPSIGGIAIGPMATAQGNTAIAIGSNEYTQKSDGQGAMGNPYTLAKSWANICIGNFSVAGSDSSYGGNDAIVLGPYSTATENESMAIGSNASVKPNPYDPDPKLRTANYSAAIGYGASAVGDYSMAIGAGASSKIPHQIVIGTTSDTVYIPGHLVVGKNTILGARSVNDNINYQVYLKGGNKGAYSSWVFLGTKDYSGGDDNFYRVGSVTAGNITINGDSGSMPSDRRLKNVKGLNNDGLDKINELKVYNYDFKKDKKHSPRVGVIAQDLQKVFPNSVKKSRSGYLFIRWDEMFYAMVNAIKELDLKIVNLGSKINALNARENSTNKKIDEIYKSNKQLSEKYNKLNNQLYNVKQENKELKAQLKRKNIIK